jgi:hypothetical protein
VVRPLLDNGADIKQRDKNDETALKAAAAIGLEQVVKLLMCKRDDNLKQAKIYRQLDTFQPYRKWTKIAGDESKSFTIKLREYLEYGNVNVKTSTLIVAASRGPRRFGRDLASTSPP